MKRSSRLCCLLLAAVHVYSSIVTVHAATRSDVNLNDLTRLPDNGQTLQKGSVYIYGDPSLDTLIPVRVLGAVGKAGVHFVPRNTDLLTLISLAGGPTKEAEPDHISIKRDVKGKSQLFAANLDDLMKTTDAKPLTVEANDTVLVPQEKYLLSENTVKTMAFVAGIATVILSAALSYNALKK